MSATAQQVYDFERVFETACKAVFSAAEVKAFTTQDSPDFQRDRPRVEITFTPGAGHGRYVLISGVQRETAWAGQYRLSVITAAEITIHSVFRSQVRSIMHGIDDFINAVEPMLRHKLQPFFRDGGTTPTMQAQEGVYRSDMIFDVNFSLQAYAWDTELPAIDPTKLFRIQMLNPVTGAWLTVGAGGTPPQFDFNGSNFRNKDGAWQIQNTTTGLWHTVISVGDPPQFDFANQEGVP